MGYLQCKYYKQLSNYYTRNKDSKVNSCKEYLKYCKAQFYRKIENFRNQSKKTAKTLEKLKKRMETLESKVQKIELDKTAKKPINIYKLKKL